ncbi:MAG: hypothetical protein KDD14_21260 [Saprospiraceae bacterium]|nr:hypothetical protein [Saprospiraceae bacterium]
MTAQANYNPAGIHVARVYEVPSRDAAALPIPRIMHCEAPHFEPVGCITLRVLDWASRQRLRPIVLCEWLGTIEQPFALCCNPYPSGPWDQWLLCRPDGLACSVAPSPEIARLQVYFLTGKLRLA